ncbi:metalloendopeptidase OMA1, mitochondrial-like [Lycorma delicatula]|uniref:metalloendopeptidase OMA1, mitochondrial-like n=1 Tax=Lycorma delicatula TaxID=130591 RepID=UPI003F514F6F
MHEVRSMLMSSGFRFFCLKRYGTYLTYRNFIFSQSTNKSIPPLSYNVCTCNFHTSKPACALPPLFWALARPVLKVGAVMLGRGIRKWWQILPKEKKKHFVQSLIEWKCTVLGWCFGFTGISYAYYYYHVEDHPVTKRKRFVIFSDDQILQITNLQISMEADNYENNKLPVYHPSYKQVKEVIHRLLEGNKDLPQVIDKVWFVTVLNNDAVNAFVFPNGHVFVYTGMLKECQNDDQLGIILGHEMAHAILGHSGEKLSNVHITEMFLMVPLVILWSVFPGMVALLYQIMTSYFINVQIELPYSRTLETEADEFGLKLAAKSCFDVRQAVVFWKNMSDRSDPLSNKFEFLSSHPSHEHRQKMFEKELPLALKLRKLCKCPDLY